MSEYVYIKWIGCCANEWNVFKMDVVKVVRKKGNRYRGVDDDDFFVVGVPYCSETMSIHESSSDPGPNCVLAWGAVLSGAEKEGS